MRIGVLSDIHEGLNRKNTNADIMAILKKWMKDYSPDVFIISGDIAVGPEKSLILLNQLQRECSQTKFLFVHGNHDIYDSDSNAAYEKLMKFPGNLANGPLELNKHWVVIGDGGWYDYTFGIKEYSKEQFSIGKFNDFTWPDKMYAHWQKEDGEVTNHYLAKMENWLKQYHGKNIIMITHVVPFSKFVICKHDPSWDFFNAMMGSMHFGQLALKYGVKKYIFGHIHVRYHEQYEGMEIICNPLGYYPQEWRCKTAEEEIYSTIKIIEI